MLEFPKAPTAAQLRYLEDLARRGAAYARAARRTVRALGELGLIDGGELTHAGRTVIGWDGGEWTVAWRVAGTRRVVRAINWAGNWAEARDMAALLVELGGGDAGITVWYVSSRAAERMGKVHAEDVGNILADNGKRYRFMDSGMLPAELLDGEVNNVAHALYEAARRTSRPTAPTLTECHAQAIDLRGSWAPEVWASLVRQAGTADERKDVSYYRQSWIRSSERPAGWSEAEAARLEVEARLGRLAVERDETLVDSIAVDEKTDRRLAHALGRRPADA